MAHAPFLSIGRGDEPMETLEKLYTRLEEIDATIDKLLLNPELTAEQLAEHDRLQTSRKAVLAAIDRENDKITRAEERQRLKADMDANRRRIAEAERTPLPRRTDADPPAGTQLVVAAQPIDHEAEKRRGFRTPREFLGCVMQAGLHSDRADPRLKPLLTVGSDEASGASDAYGSFLIPMGFSPDFLALTPEDDPMGSMITRVPMTTPSVTIPARTDKNHTTSVAGGLTVTRRPETVAGTASRTQLEQLLLAAHTLFGLAYATEELLVDSPTTFIAILERGFKEQFQYALIKERLTGSGAGEFEGVLNTGNPYLVTAPAENGQATKTITLTNILTMMSRSWGYGRAMWIANHDTLPQLGLLNQSVGVAGTGMIWETNVEGPIPNRLLGRPLMFSEYAQTLGTAGDLLLGTWSEYLEGTYAPLESAESVHVRFVNHERAFKFWIRNAAICWWRSPLTPVNSTSTLSPFVVLAGR